MEKDKEIIAKLLTKTSEHMITSKLTVLGRSSKITLTQTLKSKQLNYNRIFEHARLAN
jgi:hypothetical protein